jgi:organic hydroperoxide reductase OsmC/OhrA
MADQHNYQTSIVWQGETTDYKTYPRNHILKINGKKDLEMTADASFLGSPDVHNPEDMLLAALSSCHMLSYLALAAHKGINVIKYEDQAEANMQIADGKMRFTAATMHPVVTIAVGADTELAFALHNKAHSICFIANSVNFPVTIAPKIQSQ